MGIFLEPVTIVVEKELLKVEIILYEVDEVDDLSRNLVKIVEEEDYFLINVIIEENRENQNDGKGFVFTVFVNDEKVEEDYVQKDKKVSIYEVVLADVEQNMFDYKGN